jgi:diguanylate cyclase (GGDEF)-like protein
VLPRPFKRLIVSLALTFPALAAGLALASREQPSRASGVYGFKSYGGDQGLTTLAVSVMAQDESGFLWVGTEDGLFRYDGEAFHRFGVKDGLPDEGIYALAPAPDGSLWVLTRTGLARFEGGRFLAVGKASGLPPLENLILLGSTVACDAQSRLWIATRQGLYLGGPSGFWPVDGLPRVPTACVWINPSDGTVVTAQRQGRVFHSLPGGGWAEAKLPPPHDQGVAMALVQDTGGRTWARGATFLVRFDRDWKHPAQDLSKLLPLKALRDFALFPDAQGWIWAPTQSGLDCFQGDNGFLLDDSRGLPGSWAGSVLVDHEGSLWVGSEGVHRALGRMRWSSSTRRQGLPSDTIWALARTEDGRIWAGTQSGLAVGGSNGWSAVPETKGLPVNALLADAAGGLWASANPPGANKPGAWHLMKGWRGSWVGFPGGKTNDSIQSFSQAEDGTIWVASAFGSLWRIPPGGSPVPVTIPGLDLRANFFKVLAQKGAVFVSTDHGLALYDQGAWRVLGRPEGLKSANAQAMAMTSSGELWIAYGNAHGLSILRRNGGAWAVAAQVEVPSLIEDSIVSMAFDAKGCLWLGTSRGVKRWDGQTCLRFGRGEGLPGEDADGNAVWVDPDGVWFGMSNGLAHFDARGGSTPDVPPSARIMEVTDGGGHSLAPDGNLLRIPYAYRTMDFNYAVPSYLNESTVRLQVRLQGLEDEWRDTKFREARYTALPPGDYRFEARAAIGAGPFGNPDTLDFRILAPWWRAWWFYVLCFVFATALVLVSVRWRTAVLEKRNRSLEALVRARTLDLERANEQLQESSMVDALTGLKNRRYLGMSLPEEEGRVLRAFRTLQASGRQPSGEDLVFLLVDLDYFKTVNDTHGHAAGDAVLKLAAEAIRSATRETDTVARWGGEEFLVIARRADRHTADVIARKILDEVRSRVYPFGDNQELRLTCSVGYSAFPVLVGEPGAFGWEEVVEIADQCLYAAKRTGRDGFVGVYLDTLEEQPDLIRRLLHDLPELVGEGKVVLRSSFGEGKPLAWKQGH